MISPELAETIMVFLISVGTVALNELKERWTLRRKEHENVDLGNPEVGREMLPLIQETLTSQNEERVKRVLDLIKRKEALIYDAQRGKTNTLKALNLGEISRNVFELKTEDYDNQIKELLAQIETDVKSLGFSIDKRPV